MAESFCFMCKDAGENLRHCDFGNCVKAYHPRCLGLADDASSSDEQFICDCHFCVDCKESSDYQCLCCPIHSVCRDCIGKVEFVRVRKEGKGFCRSCLNLVLAISMEKSGDVDPYWAKIASQYKVDYKILFGDYWELIKDREHLTFFDLQEANVLLNRSFNYKGGADSEKLPDENRNFDENLLGGNDNREKTFPLDSKGILNEVSMPLKKITGSGKFPSEDQRAGENLFDDNDDSEQTFRPDSEGKASKGNISMKKRKSNKRTYIGWGSKELIEFLSSFGKDTSQPIDDFAIVCVVKEYVSQKNLFKDKKKKSFTCDDKLRSLFRKRKVKCNAIYRLVGTHLAENAVSEDESLDGSEDDDEPITKNKPRDSLELRMAKRVSERKKSCFASLVPDNLKLIYLRGSLVISFLSHPDTFEQKVVGCLVRVKNPARDRPFQLFKKPFQVGLVTGIKKSSEEYKIKDTYTDILLHVPGFCNDVKISMLTDGDFDEDDCNDLIPLVEKGLLKRPTVAELEKKVATVHEDIVNHWIDLEIVRLERRINKAHEKGWRIEMEELFCQQNLLKTQAERQRRLDEVPEIIADTEDEKKETELEVAGGKSSQENRGKKRDRASCMMDVEENSKEVTLQVADCFDVLKEEPPKGATEYVAEPFKNSVSASAESAGTDLYKQTIAAQVANNVSRKTPEALEEKTSHSSPEATQVADPPDVTKEGQPKGAREHIAEPFKILEEKPSEGLSFVSSCDMLGSDKNEYRFTYQRRNKSDSAGPVAEPFTTLEEKPSEGRTEQGTDALDILNEESSKGATRRRSSKPPPPPSVVSVDSPRMNASVFQGLERSSSSPAGSTHSMPNCAIQEEVETLNILYKEPPKDGSTTQAMDIDNDDSRCNKSGSKEAKDIDNHSISNKDNNIEVINLESDEDEDCNTEHQDPERGALQAPGAMNGDHLHMERPKPASCVALNDLGATKVKQEQHKKAHALPQTPVWHYADPQGKVQGPFSLKNLFYWYDVGYFDEDFEVWRTGQNAGQAISLSDAFRLHGLTVKPTH